MIVIITSWLCPSQLILSSDTLYTCQNAEPCLPLCLYSYPENVHGVQLLDLAVFHTHVTPTRGEPPSQSECGKPLRGGSGLQPTPSTREQNNQDFHLKASLAVLGKPLSHHD